MTLSVRRRDVRSVLLAGTVLAGVCLASAAQAQNATWTGAATNIWNDAPNWNPTTVPLGNATFGQSGVTSIDFGPGLTTVGSMTFEQGAPPYDFNILGCACDEFRITGAGIINNSSNAPTFNNNGILSFSNASTAGNAIINNFGETSFLGSSTAGNAVINNSGILLFQNTSSAGTSLITNDCCMRFEHGSTAASATIVNNGDLEFLHLSRAGNATITNNVVLTFQDASTAGNAVITNNAFLGFFGFSTAGNATIINSNSSGFAQILFAENSTAGSATIVVQDMTELAFFDNSTGGNARIIAQAGGIVDFSGTTGPNNDGVVTVGSLEGAGLFGIGALNTLVVGSNNLSTEVSGVIADDCGCGPPGPGSLVKVGTGTLTLSGINTYTGTTTVNAGTLIVNGSIAASSLLTVTTGATVGGIGFLPATFIDGGTLSPGNSIGTINVVGPLTFSPAGFYRVEVDQTTSDLTNVTGIATLAGTVQVVSPTAAYKFNSPYTIISTGGGVIGQFGTVTPPNFVNAAVNTVGNDVLLTLTSNLLGSVPGGLNQRNVAAALDRGLNFVGNNAGFEALFLLPPAALPNAMSQLSGEIATAAAPAGLETMNQFLKLMLDPFAGTRGEAGGMGGPALGFAPERRISKEAAGAYAAYRSILKAPPAAPIGRWTTWAAVYGGRSNADGDANIGSHDRDVRSVNVAGGADYRVSPDAVVGFAVSGGSANFGLSAGLGSGRSDILQGGVYGATRFDSYYLSASLAASYYDVSTDRIVSLPGAFSRLNASYDAVGFGARIEGGRRFVVARGTGVTPFAALQAQTVDAPSYAEQAAGTANFALSYNSQTTSRLRSEVGATVDQYVGAIWGGDVSVYGRIAWAHNFWRDNSVNALFQLLPVAGFSVQGAFAPENAALLAAGGDYRLGNGWSLRGKVEAELASSSTTYAASATLRAAW